MKQREVNNMAMISTKHTMAAFDLIINKLKFYAKVISYVSFGLFSIYYLYLIIDNISAPLYLIVYIILFLTVIGSFMIEMSLKKEEDDSEVEGRLKLEKKRSIKYIIKFVKFAAKSVTVGIGLYYTLSHSGFDINSLLNVFSAIILIFQLLAEFIIFFIIKYYEYIRFGFKVDYEMSSIRKILASKFFASSGKETDYSDFWGNNEFTPREEKIINTLISHSKEIEDEKAELRRKELEAENAKKQTEKRSFFGIFRRKA